MQTRKQLLVVALVLGIWSLGDIAAARDQPCMDVCSPSQDCSYPCDGLGNGATTCGEWGSCAANECAPLWDDEVSRTELGRRFIWGSHCVRYDRVLLRDVRCNFPDREFCTMVILHEGNGGACPDVGQHCAEIGMTCWPIWDPEEDTWCWAHWN
jgi:hypothetical protein